MTVERDGRGVEISRIFAPEPDADRADRIFVGGVGEVFVGLITSTQKSEWVSLKLEYWSAKRWR